MTGIVKVKMSDVVVSDLIFIVVCVTFLETLFVLFLCNVF